MTRRNRFGRLTPGASIGLSGLVTFQQLRCPSGTCDSFVISTHHDEACGLSKNFTSKHQSLARPWSVGVGLALVQSLLSLRDHLYDYEHVHFPSRFGHGVAANISADDFGKDRGGKDSEEGLDSEDRLAESGCEKVCEWRGSAECMQRASGGEAAKAGIHDA